MQPNVVWLVLDTARADAFEPYGATAGSSPAVADLARRGRAVPHAYSMSNWTLPSHAAMFSGRSPRELGLGQAPDGNPVSARPVLTSLEDRWLPSVLQRAGYDTRGVSSNVWASTASGFSTGFAEFRDVHGHRRTGLTASDWRGRLAWDVEGVRARVDDGAALAAAAVREWVATLRPPFFLFANLMECHSPYLPPQPWNDLPAPQRLRAAREARHHLTLHGIWQACLGLHDIPDGALERMRHLYYRSVTSMDDWLSTVLAALDARGLLADTVVLVTSDHGENLGDGGLMGHAFSLDERLVKVPLVVAGDAAPRLPDVVSLGSLPRLLGDALGLADHPWAADDVTDGVAVAEHDPLAEADTEGAEHVRREWSLDDAAYELLTRPLTVATDGRHKLVHDGRATVLYDLVADPGETAPRSADPADPVVAALSGPLERSVQRRGTVVKRSDDVAAADDPVVEDLEERMRLLGYL